jgi:hypothetical protein
MLMMKRRLTRADIAANLARAQKMRAAGVDIPIRED